MSVYTLILETLILEVTPRVHLDNKSREGDTCKLLLSKDNIDMKAKTLNEIKGDEIIKKLHSVQTRSTETTCFPHMYQVKMNIEYQQCMHNCD